MTREIGCKMASQSLFQKYGGFAKVSRVVLAFYDKVLDSEQIGDFFDEIDMSRLVDHQTKFIASILGGPASYTNERLHQLHAHIGISDDDFDEMAKLLNEALEERGFEPGDREAVMQEIESRRNFIVSRNGA
ncbi:MAG: group 1 truncated hemoglobin [Paracoccaceae bacterium]|nr:group 1 truncated hemoglobin [Paracoccaceae bacterium]